VFGRHTDKRGDDEARDVRILRRVPQCQLIAAGVIFGECRARLHRVRHQPIVDDIELGDVLGRFECGFSAFRIADVPLIDRVIRRDFVDLRGARLLRRGQVGDRRQHGVVDLELFGGVARLRQRLRNDNRDRIADVAGFAVSERRMRRHFHRRAVLGMNHPAADEIADLVGRELRAGQHRDTPGEAAAALLSIDLMVAWACGERTKKAYVWPGRLISSV
jgi:hypothetical protein